MRRLADTPRLRQLGDEAEIRDLAVRYCTAVDRRDWQLLSALFTVDAEFVMPTSGSVTGVDKIVERIRRGLSNFESTHHMVTNHAVTITEASSGEDSGGSASALGDTAEHGCLMQARHMHSGADGNHDHYTITGHYDDEMVRTAAGWRIMRRALIVETTSGQRPTLR